MSTIPMTMTWTDQGTSIRTDIICLILAMALHIPLGYIKLDSRKKSFTGPKERLVAIDLLDSLEIKAPPPPPVVKKKSIFSKLKALVKKEPPPPPKKVLEPKKLNIEPKTIKLDPKLKQPDVMKPKLASKSGFKTKADPKLVEKKQVSLKSLGAGVAPLSAKKVGVIEDRAKVKSDKGNFKVAQTETIQGIGSGPSLAGVSAPTIALQTGKKGSTEKFSAARLQPKEGKGAFKGGNVRGLDDPGPKLGLRDSIIARNSAPIDTNKNAGAVAGGVPGGTGTKQDAGRSFEVGSTGGSIGRSASSLGGTTKVASAKTIPKKTVQKRKKKEMFSITGPLKDRQIMKRVVPKYPAWAQAKGIEASVILQFTVTPEGNVKNSIVVRRTSGYPKLDETAITALSQWQFKPLPLDQNREEVGLITFNYTLG